MGPEDFRMMIEGRIATPSVIETRSGRSYSITHPTNARITEAYPNSDDVFVRGTGVAIIDLGTIGSIRHGHEAVPDRTV